jgi:cytochrome P450
MAGRQNTVDFDPADVPSHVPPELVKYCDFRTNLGAYPQEQLGKLHDGPRIFYTPVAHQDRGTRGAWVLTKAEDIRYVLQNAELFSSAQQPRSQTGGESWRLIPLEVDPPEHGDYRRLLNPLFSPKAVRLQEEAIRNWAIELTEGLADKRQCDFVAEYCELYPVGIFLDLLGLPRSDLQRFRAWANTVVHDRAGRGQAMVEIKEFLRGVLADRIENPGEDLVSTVAQFKIGDRPLTEEEMLGIVVMLFIGGLDTVVSSLSFQFRWLAENVDQQNRLRENYELLPDAVEELFRAFSIVTTGRIATQDTELAGVQIKKGDMIEAATMLSTRDPDEFENPHEIDLTRSPNRHNAFSFGPHRCLGSHLARLEVTIAIKEWLKRVPEFTVQPGAKINILGGGVWGLDSLPLQW